MGSRMEWKRERGFGQEGRVGGKVRLYSEQGQGASERLQFAVTYQLQLGGIWSPVVELEERFVFPAVTSWG